MSQLWNVFYQLKKNYRPQALQLYNVFQTKNLKKIVVTFLPNTVCPEGLYFALTTYQ